MAEAMMHHLRPLALGRRKSTSAPTIPLPSTPPPPVPPLPAHIPTSPTAASEAFSDAISTYEVRSANVQRNPYDAITDAPMPGVHTYQRGNGEATPHPPTPVPPFRLLAPSVVGGQRTPSPDAGRPLSMMSEAPVAPMGLQALLPERSPAPSLTPTPGRMAPVSFDHAYERARTLELRSKPLHLSEYGRRITHLVTLPWVIAPSGLAAVVFTEDTPDEIILDAAAAINLLVCGTEAFRSIPAGILAVHSLTQLNRLLVRSGLSPIVPQPAPPNWPPLAARQPPDFLLETFRPRAATSPNQGNY